MRRHFLRIKQTFLNEIIAGRKTLEVRVAYPNLASVAAGDVLNFNGRHRFPVVGVRRYDSFASLLEHESAATISPASASPSEVLAALREIYPPEKERLGVLAVELGVEVHDAQ
jgi:ASC-1-like (ASCH) protein